MSMPTQENYEIKQRKEAFYQQCITPTLAFWEQANTDMLYYSGSQQLWSGLYGNLPAYVRKNFNFNFIRPTIEMVKGRQAQHRKTTVVVPRENGSQKTADQLTKVLMWEADTDGTYEKITDAFGKALVTGMSLIQLSMDFDADPVSGQLMRKVRPYNSFLIDPYTSQKDLSDCQGIIIRDFLTPQVLINKFPDHADQIMAQPINGYSNNGDLKFQYTPQSFNTGLVNLITYDQYYYMDYRNQKCLVDVNTGETTEWKTDDEDLLRYILQTEPSLQVLTKTVPTVRLALFAGNCCVYDGPNGLFDQYPIVPVWAYYSPEIPYYEWRVQSLVRPLRDAQFLYNRFLINMSDVVESQTQSGWKYKENALVNPNDVFMTGPGKGLALKATAQMTDVEKIQPTEASNTAFKLAETFIGLKGIVTGVSDELMGQNEDKIAGIVQQLRMGAGLVTLQSLFDNLDYAQKLLGKLEIKAITNNYAPAKIRRILGEDPTPFFYNKEFGTYDCTVEEGFYTSTQKQMQYAQLLQARELLGDVIPTKTLIDAMTIQNKDRLIKDIEEREQQLAQSQQAQMQQQMQLQQAELELAQARAQADRGLAVERVSRVEENKTLAVERMAEAEKDQEQALLNKIKALKELEALDLASIEKLVLLAERLKALETNVSPTSLQDVPEVTRGQTLAQQ